MIVFKGLDVEVAKYDKTLFSYLDSFFDFDSLVTYVKLTKLGLDRYSNDLNGVLSSILMCTDHNIDPRKFYTFVLDCKEWDVYYSDHFIGFDEIDLNRCIAKLVADKSLEIQIEKGK